MPARKKNSSLDDGPKEMKIRKPVISRKRFYWLLVAFVVVGFLYIFRGLFVAAMVNGKPISRLSVIKQLEKQNGKQVLDGLVTEAMIFSEARKREISILPKDVDAEIEEIRTQFEGQGGNLDEELTLRGMSKSDLRKQVEMQMIIEKMFEGEVEVTDQEVADYIELNKEYYGEMEEEELKNTVRRDLEQQELGTQFQTWLTEAKEASGVKYFVSY